MNKILKTNGLIFIGYTLLASIAKDGFSVAIFSAIFIGIHVGILFIMALISFLTNKRENAIWLLLSGFLVLIIGFGTCMGNASLHGGSKI